MAPHTMDHSLFGCLRSPHAPAQGLHPAFTQSPLALHGRSDHVSYPDLPSSYPGEEGGVFSGPTHRGHLPQPSQQHPVHTQHPPCWPVPPQMPSPNTRHSLCLPPAEAPELCSGGGPNLCAANPSLGSGDPASASCVSGEYGRQTLSPDDPDRRNSKGKSDSSGKTRTSTALLHVSDHFKN